MQSDTQPIYLDYNATTPVDPAVVDAMVPYLFERFGNASSNHMFGNAAQGAMDLARRSAARLIGARSDEIVFTGSGSEANNLAIKGTVLPKLDRRPHVITSTIEHPAVTKTLQYLHERFGVEVTQVPVNGCGVVDSEDIRSAIRPETVLISIMHANNEVGTVQPVSEIGMIAESRGVVFHSDAAQTAGKIPIDVPSMNVDLLSVAGHKLYAPKGVGFLYVREGTTLEPLIHGASQEFALRAGTENIASIVGLGVACDLAWQGLKSSPKRMLHLRDTLHERLREEVPGVQFNGHLSDRLPNTLNLSFPRVPGTQLLDATPQIAASTGSACHSGGTEPSAVLLAMGLSRERASSAVRLSVGRWTSEQDAILAARALASAYLALASRAQASASV